VGYILRRVVLDALPAGVLAISERAVLGELADLARDDTRIAYGADLLETIRRRVGFASVKQVRNAFTKLAKKGVEVRVTVYNSVTTGTDMVAWRGHQTTYRIPADEVLAAAAAPEITADSDVAQSEIV
jgi:hypothetical protein